MEQFYNIVSDIMRIVMKPRGSIDYNVKFIYLFSTPS